MREVRSARPSASVPWAVVPVRDSQRRLGGLLALVVFWVSLAVPASAQEPPTLTVATDATYTADVAAGRVEVEFGYRFENQTAATAFPGFFESIPVDAVDLVVRVGSRELATLATGEEDGFTIWLVGFPTPLDPGDTLEVTVSWAIEGGASLPGPIVEPGALAFDVYVPGPEGATWSAPRFVVPDGFTLRSSVGVSAPYEIVRVEFLNPAGFVSTTSALSPEVTIADWEPSSVWAANVLSRAGAVIPELDSWFGPRVDPVEVRRAFPSAEHAAVGADAVELARQDAGSIDHQLAHVWLADVPVDEDWFIEGLAAAFAGGRPDPSGAADVVPLVVDEIGAAGVRAIVDMLRAGTITYPGVVAEPQPLPPDWRTLLDHLEGPAGTEGVDELFRTAVIDADEGPVLDRRAAARIDYAALEFRAGGWTLPPYLRHAMASWEFDEFSAAQGAVSDTLLRRDSLFGWEESLGLVPQDDGKALFEAAESDMSEVDALLDEQEAALAAFDEAERLVNGDRGLLAAVGLFGHDPDGDLEALREAWAEGDYGRVEDGGHELAELVEGSVGVGTIRLLVPALVLIALWQLVRVGRRRLRRSSSRRGWTQASVNSEA